VVRGLIGDDGLLRTGKGPEGLLLTVTMGATLGELTTDGVALWCAIVQEDRRPLVAFLTNAGRDRLGDVNPDPRDGLARLFAGGGSVEVEGLVGAVEG
jgi:hypothetical protein